MPISSKLKSLLKFKISSPLVFYLPAIFLFGLLIYAIDYLTGYDDWCGVLTEAHGMLLDILVLGVLLTIFENRRSKIERIERYHEEIDDFRFWRNDEAKVRIFGNIKRLVLKENVRKLILSNCTLSELHFEKEIRLEDSSFEEANLSRSIFSGFHGVKLDFRKAFLIEAKFHSCNFQDCSFIDTDFFNSTFHETQFNNCRFSGLENGRWEFSNFNGINFSSFKITKSNFDSCTFNKCVFMGDVELTEICKYGTNCLDKCTFIDCDFSKAVISENDKRFFENVQMNKVNLTFFINPKLEQLRAQYLKQDLPF